MKERGTIFTNTFRCHSIIQHDTYLVKRRHIRSLITFKSLASKKEATIGPTRSNALTRSGLISKIKISRKSISESRTHSTINTLLKRTKTPNMTPTSLPQDQFPQTLTNPTQTISVSLTHDPLSLPLASTFLKSPSAGANVLFTGTTRNTFDDKPVTRLSYTSYPKLALRTLLALAEEVQTKHDLEKVFVVHRLGEVKVEEESIIVGVSAKHRGEGWRGAEELLELVKARAEIWKMEWFLDGRVVEGRDGEVGREVGIWRANRDGVGSAGDSEVK